MGALTWRGAAAGALAATAVAGSLVVWRGEAATVTVPAQQDAPTTLDGATLFRVKGCATCHKGPDTGPTGAMGIAPDLSDLPEVAADRVPGMPAREYVTESIRNPEAFVVAGFTSVSMPRLEVSDAEIDALADYLLAG